tara:strand:- start:223 stop:636 length:414 start_codon:yes stop_codon:yes gene_type:complete
MLNKVILIGRLGSDPELRTTDSGVAVCNISLATSETWTADGEKKERTEWHRLVFWRRNAEIVSEYLRKGSQVWIEGKLQTRSFTKDDVERKVTEIVVNNVLMLDSKSGGGGSKNGANDYRKASQSVKIEPDAEHIPF